jgi:hypothetical protein
VIVQNSGIRLLLAEGPCEFLVCFCPPGLPFPRVQMTTNLSATLPHTCEVEDPSYTDLR